MCEDVYDQEELTKGFQQQETLGVQVEQVKAGRQEVPTRQGC